MKKQSCPKCKAPELLAHVRESRQEAQSGSALIPVAPAVHHYRAFKCGRYETKHGHDSNWTTHLECRTMKCQCGAVAEAVLEDGAILYRCSNKHPATVVGKFSLPG